MPGALQISRNRYNAEQMIDSNSLARALATHPAKLSKKIVFEAGKKTSKSFPLLQTTEGAGNVTTIDKDEVEYDVMAELRYTRNLAETVSATALGAGGQQFDLIFEDKWFIPQYVLVSPSDVQMRIMRPPVAHGTNWKYTVQIVSSDLATELPASDLVAGTPFGQLFAPVGTDFSRGNASNSELPGKVRHKLSTIRKSYTFSGKAKEFVMNMELPTENGTSKFWMKFEEWQYMMQWFWEKESLLWYGKQSYNDQGKTQLKDEDTGYPIIIGPGVLEQIQNKDTYSYLTVNKLKNTVRDLFFGLNDAETYKQLILYTGTGGMEEFDNAMKEEVKNNNYIVLTEGKFISGSGSDLTLGAYFKTYRHVDGHTITVRKLPQFDKGPVADVRPKHPKTNLSLESYRMVFLDQSMVEGESNVVQVRRKNREFKKWYTAGSVIPDGFSDGTFSRASDIDGASVHMLAECGVILRRFNTSLDMECVAS